MRLVTCLTASTLMMGLWSVGCAGDGGAKSGPPTMSSVPTGANDSTSGGAPAGRTSADQNGKRVGGIESDAKGTAKMSTQYATFGAGCFWGVEAAFREVEGVTATEVGYSGGAMKDPTYKDVCTDSTGHAEVVRVEFDPAKVSYDDLLEVFWKNHDPTQVNRQGPDFGSQYRSAIFFHSPEQERSAKASKEALGKSGRFSRPIATEIVSAGPFYRAEDYHQQYLEKRGLRSCHK